MSRITKLVAAATLLAVPLIQACGEGTTPPPPTGSFAGKVMIEGEGIDGVNVALSSGETATTAGGGAYRFDDIEEGTYTITISGYPEDASFASASASATLRDDGQLVTVDFSGKWVRTAALLGSVTVEGNPIVGIMVKIAGMSESETLTGSGGQYSFTGLRKGDYTVQISEYDDEDIGFSSTVEPVELDVGQSMVKNFEGTYVRASSILVEVKIEGNGIEDVEVSIQGKGETHGDDTQGNGSVLFEDLRKGEYVIVITNPDPDEYEFEETSQRVEVAYDDMENVQFSGVELRTASIEGVITVDGHGPLGGVTVSVNGKGDDPDPVVTLGNGRFSFDRLYAGEYTVDIFGYDDDEYGFEVTSRTVTVARKETGTADFGGILLRTGAIAGEVTVKGEGLPDVTVTVSGGLKSETFTRNTNPQGMFEVDRLHQGDYTVTISGYDEREYGFEVTTKNVTVELRSTAPVAFDGILLRTAGVSGRVTIAGEPMSGVMVTLSGEEDRDPETTNDNGQYGFSGLAAGDYTITLSGYDDAEYEFDPSSVDFSLELDEAGIENFDGRSLRTVAVMGTVTAEGDPLEGVTARLLRVITGSAGDILGQMTTDGDGAYGFGPLLAGTYGVEISGFDDEFKFPTTFQLRPVATDDTAMFHFDAQIIREASVSGMVSVDGEGMGGVMVMLTGDHDTDEEMETDSDGEYEFDGLRKGSYTVTIENPDADAYDFPTTSRKVNLSVSQKQDDVSFAGSMLRRASISGQVYVVGPDMSLEGVTVKLRGEDRKDMETDGNGEYNFPGLAGGDYTVSIENPDDRAYTFEVMEVDVDDLGEEEARIVDFEGGHTMTASVSGMMFVDEMTPDSMYQEGEAVFDMVDIPLKLVGPAADDVTEGMSDSTGMYSFDSLQAGTYRVMVDHTDAVKRALDNAGYMFIGAEGGVAVEVAADTDMDVHFPFRITKQTVTLGAFLATNTKTGPPVGGVAIELYPTAEDADDGTNPLGTLRTASTGDMPGYGSLTFPRSKDKGPGGGAIDYLVYAKVKSVGNPDLKLHDNKLVEIAYDRADRETDVPQAAKYINTRVNFQWWVKSNATAKDGNQFLEGWVAKAGTMKLDTTGENGLAKYSGTVSSSQMQAMIRGTAARFSVSLDADQTSAADMDELWKQSAPLSHVHDGLKDPSENSASDNDLGAIYVTWTTQAMVLGIYREADDVDGYTDHQSRHPGGDHRPVSRVAAEMATDYDDGVGVRLMKSEGRRWVPYTYDSGACTRRAGDNSRDTTEAVFRWSTADDDKKGTARVACLPAGDEFTIEFDLGSDDRALVGQMNDEIDAYSDRHMGASGTVVGIFGAKAGGVPEVRVCLASEGTSDDECATWGYQWETGTVMGNVGENRGHKLFIEPTTENHGADTASATSGTEGAYDLDELRDGVYEITAYSTSTWKVNGDSVVEVVVYHDEDTDDGDTLTKYVGTASLDTVAWSTTQLGLEIMGYIGNDADVDGKLRGSEVMEDITVSLSGGSPRISRTADTDASGLYKFEDLPAGRYTITPSSPSNVKINRGFRRTFGDNWTRNAITNATSVSADEYPSFDPDTIAMPYWSYTSGSIRNSSVTVRSGDVSASLINFTFLFTDGEAEGRVNNVSGSNTGIEVTFMDVFLNREYTQRTNFRGDFSRTRLMEGPYSATVANAGERWLVPCMTSSGASGKPDDDGSYCPTTVTLRGETRGEDDYESLGMLHVYDVRESANDRPTGTATVSARWEGDSPSNYDSLVRWPTGWSRGTDTEETENTTSVGTISWASATARISGFRAPTGGRVQVMKGSEACSFSGCVLDYNRTGSTSEGDAKATVLTVMVTAENGYDDHEYLVTVSRAAPYGNEIGSDRIKRYSGDEDDDYVTSGDGSYANPFLVLANSGSSANVRFDLEVHGDEEEDNQRCAQSVRVTDAVGDSVHALASDTLGACIGTRYRLSSSGDGSRYSVYISSEDSVERRDAYYLDIRAQGNPSDARLRSLTLSRLTLDPDFDPDETEYEATANNDTSVTTVRASPYGDASDTVITPADSDADASGHQVNLGEDATTTITIEVTSEDGTETKTYTVEVFRKGTNDATLSNITASQGTLDPAFAADNEGPYTVEVEHDDGAVTFTPVKSDGNQSVTPATISLDPAAGASEDGSFEVVAADETDTMTYMVRVTRGDEPDPAEPGLTFLNADGDDVTASGLEIPEGTADTVGGTTYQVVLNTQPDSAIELNVIVPDGVTASPTSLEFSTTNWDDPQAVALTATPQDSNAVAHDQDTVVRHAVTAASDQGGDGYEEADTTVLDIILTERHTKGVILTAMAKEIPEGVAGTYSVSLNSAPTENATVYVTGVPTDVTVTPTQLTFTAGDAGNYATPQEVTITPDENEDTAAWSGFALGHDVSGGDYHGDTGPDLAVQPMDDEAPAVYITVTEISGNEGVSFTYSIGLTQAPAAGETVTVDLLFDTRDFTIPTVSFNFTAVTEQAVTVTPKSVDADATKSISHAVSNTDDVTDAVYDDVTEASDLTVHVKDVPDDS